jgi:hypothetical protein
MNTKTNKPTIKLIGKDGNAFEIISACRHAAREAGWSSDEIEKVCKEMTAGNYDNLLQVAMKHFDVE